MTHNRSANRGSGVQEISQFVESCREQYSALADKIWAHAELGFEETQSSRAHIELLKAAGFIVREGIGGLPTSFVAEAGSGAPIIGILGEYDALPNLNQESMATDRRVSSEIGSGNGHGCGHNILGVAAHLAAVAVQAMLSRHGQSGTVRFYGCPAEENGSGKAFMVREGAFDDLDAALSWHPNVATSVWTDETLANRKVYFRFKGRAAHASHSAHLGRSALDAAELMNVGANYLREHIPPDCRLHYAVTNPGGSAPNVVQAEAEVLYMVRGLTNEDVEHVYERLVDVARGAALMAGCHMELEIRAACANIVLNDTINAAMQKNLEAIGAPIYDDEEVAFAQAIQDTVTPEELADARRQFGHPTDGGPICCRIPPLSEKPTRLHASTDVGDVSQITPTAQCWIASYAFGTTAHSWQWVAQGKSSMAHKGMLLAAKVMAATAIDLIDDASLLAAAKEEFERCQDGRRYVSSLPPEVLPPLARHQSL